MTPDGKTALPRKRYYDLFSYVVTQLAFSFTTAPFVLLDIGDSLVVWMRVYFYTVIGTIAASLFLLTPGKAWLSSRVRKYQSSAQKAKATASTDVSDASTSAPVRPSLLHREGSHSTQRHPTYLGLPNDPGKAWDEMVDEFAMEIERRRSDGKPLADEVRNLLREKFGDGGSKRAVEKKEL